VGQVNWNAGDAWNTILAGTSDEIIIYANDAEIVAEVSQGAGNPDALNNYIWLLQQCSNNSATVGVWKLTDVLNDPGFTTQALTLQSGTYGLLGEWYGYGGGNNSWYGDWAAYVGPSNLDAHMPKWKPYTGQGHGGASKQSERDGLVRSHDQPPRDGLARRWRDLGLAASLLQPYP
jgi:hypothetical protein